jgi:hypothetical protein
MRSCVYYLNESKQHVKMALNSLKMLRFHNKNIPVRVFILSNEFIPKYKFTKNLLEFCSSNDIETVKKPIKYDYFCSNKYLIKDCPEERILFIDSDTFIFGDVENIFKKYENCDFAGCKNKWVEGRNWRFLNGNIPFNGGVQLYNNNSHKKILKKLPTTCNNLGEDLEKWIEGRMDWNREEMAISKIVIEDKYSFKYFEKEDCMIPLVEDDLENFKKTTIFHSFTHLWERVYKKVVV